MPPQPPPYPDQPQPPYGGQPPYGQQPPQNPGPYGQQPPQNPGPYGSPYPQQPYPQQPQPPYQGWNGMPPVAPPPKKSRTGLILGIVGGAVALIVSVLVVLGTIGYKAATSFPEGKRKLTLPQTLLDGKYELAKDLSDTEGKQIGQEADGAWDAKDTHGVVGSYSLGGDETKGTLVVSGMYGRFKNTDTARRNMMKGAAQTDGAKVAVQPKDFDLEVTVSCEVLTQDQMGSSVTLPMCAWADDNTGATVAIVDMATVSKDPSTIDLAALAKQTIRIRSEAVKPIL
ncbi:hypothetical protein HZZ00_30715 [Streptomyces sp. NEAU-sy36]|uniref:hypothetical protein n=1 Tax=unclassified Streptomyces TaxID=2593676 RepID=UPI0015D60380|nr:MULTISPECIES: hypothetical protein [unclassified Streptomyces]QLJ06562.1 hypothetical protein HZZ00_30715 [Streptomyces sp. NEAU-sy36]